MGLRRRSAVFIADSPGPDFLNSGTASSDCHIDWLHNGETLLSWLQQAAIQTPEAIQRLRARSTVMQLDSVAGRARYLRRWLGQFVRARMGRPLDGSELKELTRLNHLLEQQQKYVQIAAPDNGAPELELRTSWRRQAPQLLLLPIAEALVRVVCE
jgi:hypothetical protein